ncbi:ABC transporter permease [Streptomyces radicis]|uniref:ABC transporter permease subunit n=1 Tax=Streptomyces radicis TaxID=1750517 RepID=A0A3A9VRV4_9ACTN|nr:ABC transporter permease subunit [Streptomyces radicis]RKN03470.1 ABC transporter permease subunit [Streptomyces radicis]RKN13332.1 ABC transporter permease subunit [Streptomyces radicis]
MTTTTSAPPVSAGPGPAKVRAWPRTVGVSLTRIGIIVLAAALVELAVELRWATPLQVAPPSIVLPALWDGLTTGNYLSLLGTTLAEVGVAFLCAATVGTTLGYLLWRRPLFGRAYEPLLYALASSPIVLLYPVSLVMFGRTPVAVAVLGFVAGLFPVLISTYQAFRRLDDTYIKVAKVLRLTPGQSFLRVLLPAALPSVLVGLRLGLTLTMLTVIAMEYLANVGGVGAELSLAYLRLRSADMYAVLLLIISLSVTFLFLLNLTTRLVVKR